MKRILLIAISAFLFIQTYAQEVSVMQWAKSVGASYIDMARAIAVDDEGSVYTTGVFMSTVDFDPGAGVFELSSAGNYDVFLQKLDSDGNFVWAYSFGAGSDDHGEGIHIDADGNIYVVGAFAGTVDFDPGAGVNQLVSTSSNTDAFVLKLDQDGNYLWAKKMGGGQTDIARSIDTDSNGNVYITGEFMSTADMDPSDGVQSFVCFGILDAFVTKLNSDGDFVWAKQLGGSRHDFANSICIDSQDRVIVTGYFLGTADFDPGEGIVEFTATGDPVYYSDIYIVQMDMDGNFIWAKQIGSEDDEEANEVTVDHEDNLIITGSFYATVDFDPGAEVFELTSAGSRDAFVLKLTHEGDFIWVRGIGSSNNQVGYSVVTDAEGGVYTTGQASNEVDYNPGEGVYLLSVRIFVQKLNSDGAFVWATGFNGNGDAQGASVAVDAEGHVYIAGAFVGEGDFDPSPANIIYLDSNGSHDVVVVKLSQEITTMSVSENTQANLFVYPNPTHSKVCVQTDEALSFIAIYNATGAWMQTERNNTFSIEHLPAGVYYLQLKTQSDSHTLPLIKE